jgi:hypothetical protein
VAPEYIGAKRPVCTPAGVQNACTPAYGLENINFSPNAKALDG